MADETPNPEFEIQKEYTLKLNDKSYLLHIDIKEEETLFFTCTPIENKPQFYYTYKCTLNSLRKMSKAFHLYQNLTEVLFLFEELNKNKLITLEVGDDENYNNSDDDGTFSMSNLKKNEYPEFIHLVVKLFVLVKEEVMLFPLEKKVLKENKKIMNNLKNEINKISKEFNKVELQYEKKINSLKKEVKLLRNENSTFKSQISELINKIDELKQLLFKRNDKPNSNSIQDLISRVEKLEEWKNDASFTNKNLSCTNDSQQNKSEKKNMIYQKEIIKKNEVKDDNKTKTNANINKLEENIKINKSPNANSNRDRETKEEKGISEENEEIIEEEIEEEEEDSNNTKVKKETKVSIVKVETENNSEVVYADAEGEEEEDEEEEEEKEIINNNKTSFNVSINLKEKLMKSLISKSSIIKNSYEIGFLLNKLINLNPVSFTLLYKGSQDTDNSKIFHQKCDGQKNILLFILTNKKYIFGGYTSVGFDSSGNAKNDDQAFLFSVDFQKIYDIKHNLYAIFCNKNCGPIFCAKSDGLYNICIPDKYFKCTSYTCKKGIPFNTTEPFELNHGEKEFQVVELEIFRIDKN